MKYEVLEHASIRLEVNNKVIYFDPYQVDTNEKADYIFITHDHYDHYDVDSINILMTSKTKLVIPKYLEEKVINLTENYLLVEPNHTYQVEDFTFKTVSSYNKDKTFHKKETGNVGYILALEKTKLYVMGDTDALEELKNLTVDICFVPIGGTYTMNCQEAATYINDLKPKVAIPIHYGSIVGDISLKDKFKDLVNQEIEVEIFIK